MFICNKSKNQCVFCQTRKENRSKCSQTKNGIDPDALYSFPQRLRAALFSKRKIGIKLTAIICGKCLQIDDSIHLNGILDHVEMELDPMLDEKILGKRWKEKYDGTMRALLQTSRGVERLKDQNARLKQNQKDRFDEKDPYRVICVDLTKRAARDKYLRQKRESEENYTAENVVEVDDKPVQRTNRCQNFVSYWKLSQMDCFKLCHNTRTQIAEMAEAINETEELVFFWWHRFYRNSSFVEQSILFGVSKDSGKQAPENEYYGDIGAKLNI